MAGPASPVCTAPSRKRRPTKLVPLKLADACGASRTKGTRAWIKRPRPKRMPKMNEAKLIACHQCDLLQWEAALLEGGTARCQGCRAALYRSLPARFDRALAFTSAAAILFVLANCFPIVGLWVNGTLVEATLLGAAWSLYVHGMWPIADLVFVTTLLMPSLNIAAVIYLLLPLAVVRLPPKPQLVLPISLPLSPRTTVQTLLPAILLPP